MGALQRFQETIGYEFRDERLLVNALTHSSYANENKAKKAVNNERLEFLGDAVLELVSSEYIYKKYPGYSEGKMSKFRASLVCEPTLAYCTKAINLSQYIRLGKGEDQTGGRERKSILSDAFEALIGAIFLDGGMKPAKDFILKYVLYDVDHMHMFYDSKTSLQEIIQAKSDRPLTYKLISETGPDHNKHFVVNAMVGDEILACGQGHTKKGAEQDAAYNALVSIKGLEK